VILPPKSRLVFPVRCINYFLIFVNFFSEKAFFRFDLYRGRRKRKFMYGNFVISWFLFSRKLPTEKKRWKMKDFFDLNFNECLKICQSSFWRIFLPNLLKRRNYLTNIISFQFLHTIVTQLHIIFALSKHFNIWHRYRLSQEPLHPGRSPRATSGPRGAIFLARKIFG
jgi:hypothetical protein